MRRHFHVSSSSSSNSLDLRASFTCKNGRLTPFSQRRARSKSPFAAKRLLSHTQSCSLHLRKFIMVFSSKMYHFTQIYKSSLKTKISWRNGFAMINSSGIDSIFLPPSYHQPFSPSTFVDKSSNFFLQLLRRFPLT